MINKRNQWRNNAKDRAFKINPTLDRSFRLLFGPANIAGCSVCCEDNPNLLGIYPHDYHEKEWRILCDKCHSKINRWSVDNKLQKQIGGSYV